jgi:riboflavin kinase/FMN adenylyltransferase
LCGETNKREAKIRVFYGSDKFRPPKNPVVAFGVFDGVHRGHQFIFKKAIERAKEIGGTSVVYTFDPHPVKILVPNACPPMITTLPQKLELIAGQGIGQAVVEKFTKAFARQTPEKFFQKIVLERLRAREIFVGYNFTFGVHRSGTIDHLQVFAQEAGIRATIVEPFLWKETLVSSTEIRRLLSRGDLVKAEDLLGRPYFVDGQVIHGRGIGGKELGIHTANIRPQNDLILPTGVYVTYTLVSGKRFQSVTNIGPNPTFGPGPLSIETHLLNFKKTIFGKTVRIEFLEKIREEIAFASAKDLANQIQNDIKIAKEHFAKREAVR